MQTNSAHSRKGESERIGQVLRVLDGLRRERPVTPNLMSAARERVSQSVAASLGVIEWTVRDKHSRQMELTIEEFETLALRWLRDGDTALRWHLEAHITDRYRDQDLDAIRRFFS